MLIDHALAKDPNDVPAPSVYVPGQGFALAQGSAPRTDSEGYLCAPLDVATGGSQTMSIAAGTATNTQVKTGPGRLCRILVTTPGTAALLIYDSASSPTGTIIGCVPASAPIGVYDSQLPANFSILVAGSVNAPAVTISFH